MSDWLERRRAVALEAQQEQRVRQILDIFRAARQPEGVDLGKQGITVDDLNLLLAKRLESLSPDQRRFILDIANRAEIKGKLPEHPEHLVYTPSFLEAEPSSEALEKKLAPLSAEEVSSRAQEFISLVKDGKIPIFAYGHNSRLNQDFNLDELSDPIRRRAFTGETASSKEGSVFFEELKAGYREANKSFFHEDYERLMSHEPYAISPHGFAPLDQEGSAQDNLDNNKFLSQWNRLTDCTEEKGYYYMARSKVVDLRLKNASVSPESQAIIHEKQLKQAREVPTAAIQALDVVLVSHQVDPSSRAGYMAFTILFENANKARRHFSDLDAPEDPQKHRYQYFLRAMAANPGFFLEALKRLIPKSLTTEYPGGDFYDPREKEQREIDVRFVKELQAVGRGPVMKFKPILETLPAPKAVTPEQPPAPKAPESKKETPPIVLEFNNPEIPPKSSSRTAPEKEAWEAHPKGSWADKLTAEEKIELDNLTDQIINDIFEYHVSVKRPPGTREDWGNFVVKHTANTGLGGLGRRIYFDLPRELQTVTFGVLPPPKANLRVFNLPGHPDKKVICGWLANYVQDAAGRSSPDSISMVIKADSKLLEFLHSDRNRFRQLLFHAAARINPLNMGVMNSIRLPAAAVDFTARTVSLETPNGKTEVKTFETDREFAAFVYDNRFCSKYYRFPSEHSSIGFDVVHGLSGKRLVGYAREEYKKLQYERRKP